MTLVQSLIQTLSNNSPTTGTLVGLIGNIAKIATQKGVKECKITINTPLRLGDKVAINNGTITAKLRSDDEVPHFIV